MPLDKSAADRLAKLIFDRLADGGITLTTHSGPLAPAGAVAVLAAVLAGYRVDEPPDPPPAKE